MTENSDTFDDQGIYEKSPVIPNFDSRSLVAPSIASKNLSLQSKTKTSPEKKKVAEKKLEELMTKIVDTDAR